MDCPLCDHQAIALLDLVIHFCETHAKEVGLSPVGPRRFGTICWCGHYADKVFQFAEHVELEGGLAAHLLDWKLNPDRLPEIPF